MPAVHTCLWFERDGEQAARFYTSLVRDSSMGDVVPAAAGSPGTEPGSVVTVSFTLAGQSFQIITGGGPVFVQSPAASIVLECETADEADAYWERLAEGGSEGQCGWLQDRWGLWWQIVPRQAIELLRDPQTSVAAAAAMNEMSRIDVEALLRAVGR